jgi:BRCT domain type II-containing protein
MTRKEIYAKIKELNLSEEVKKQFGDNYTRVPSDKLEALINSKASKKKVLPIKEVKIKKTNAEAALFYLSSLLLAKKVITRAEADQLASYLKH